MKRITMITILLLQVAVFAFAKDVVGIQRLKKEVTFEVVLDTAIKSPPILIIYTNTFFRNTVQYVDRLEIQPASNTGNTYMFILPGQDKSAYFTIGYKEGFKNTFPLEFYHFEPGDHVKIAIKPAAFKGDFDVDFSGREVAKYICQNEFIYAIRAEQQKMQVDTIGKDNYTRTLRYIEACTAVLNKYRPQLSDFSYQLLKADIISKLGRDMLSHVRIMFERNQEDDDDAGDQQVANDYFKRYKPLNFDGIADSILALSVHYGQYKLMEYTVGRVLKTGVKDKIGIFEDIKKLNSGPVRDKLMVLYLIRNSKALGQYYNRVIQSAILLTKDQQCLTKIQEFEHNAVGSKAFNFSLTDMHGKKVRMEDFKGKTVFIDYYFTGCTNCKIFYRGTLKNIEEKYKKNKNMVFVSISIDKDKMKWINGIKRGEYNDPDGVNLYTNGQGTSYELIRYYNIMGYPTLMLINKHGNIQNFTNGQLRNRDLLIKELDKALAL